MSEAAVNSALASIASNLVDDGVSAIPPERLAPAQRRVKIILEENDNIPPTGQFFGADGKGYVLRPGEKAEVPMSIISILNTAVMSTPVFGDGQRVSGYRDRLRFPYRVILDEAA